MESMKAALTTAIVDARIAVFLNGGINQNELEISVWNIAAFHE
jgi:hypothetical protein